MNVIERDEQAIFKIYYEAATPPHDYHEYTIVLAHNSIHGS